MLDFLLGGGLFALPWWGYFAVAAVATHLTIICVTLFLHRSQAHGGVRFHPAVNHAMRFWLWLTTGMVTREWVAIHRKHHARVESEDDPHSPQLVGLRKVLWRGTELYRAEARNPETLQKYGQGTPDDWLERSLYTPHEVIGVASYLIVLYALLGFYGVAMWAVHMMWIPFLAAGVINGVGHYFGYRNFETRDSSTNIVNIGLLIGGEELHNNHHAFPSSAKLSCKWWEFDVGWLYIRILRAFGLAKVMRVAPRPGTALPAASLSAETSKALLQCHMHIMAEYVKRVAQPAFDAELKRASTPRRRLLRAVRQPFMQHESNLDAKVVRRIKRIIAAPATGKELKTVHDLGHSLHDLWHHSHGGYEHLAQALREWCQKAERAGFATLTDFATRLNGCTPQAAALSWQPAGGQLATGARARRTRRAS